MSVTFFFMIYTKISLKWGVDSLHLPAKYLPALMNGKIQYKYSRGRYRLGFLGQRGRTPPPYTRKDLQTRFLLHMDMGNHGTWGIMGHGKSWDMGNYGTWGIMWHGELWDMGNYGTWSMGN